MLYYDRTGMSKGIDHTKSTRSKECMICDYWLFNHGFEFQDSLCNGCHDLAILRLIISDIAIITAKNVDYLCIIHNIALIFSLLKGVLFYFFALLYTKWLTVNIIWKFINL